MAKVAGRKNSGAWWRFNQLRGNSTQGFKDDLRDALVSLDTLETYYDLIDQTALDSGLANEWPYASFAEWCATLANEGIPLDVWMGKVSYDLYTKETIAGKVRYVPTLAPLAGPAGIDVRAACKQLEVISFQLKYLRQLNAPAVPTLAASPASQVENKNLTAGKVKSKFVPRRSRTLAA